MSTTLNWGLNRLRQVIREPFSALSTYSAGTVSVTLGSASVTGSGTSWLTNVKPGETFFIAAGQYYHILSVESDTALTLTANYAGTTGSGKSYTVTGGRNTNATLVDELNSAHRLLANEIESLDLNYLAVTGTISYVANTELYALPTTNGVCRQILLVKRTDLSNEKEIYPIVFQERHKYLLESTGIEATDIHEYYYPLGVQIGIVPIPTTAHTNNITVHYLPEATDLTIGTSTIILSDDFRELWVYQAAIGLTDDPAVMGKYQQLHGIMLTTLGPRQLQEGRRVIYKNDDDYN